MAGKNYIATAPLFVGYARAHNPGDVVPDANVEEHGWQDGVAREGTKAANDAQGIDYEAPATAPAVPAKP
jgi:hypothetical protein